MLYEVITTVAQKRNVSANADVRQSEIRTEWRKGFMKGHFSDIKTGICYTQHGDYYLPDLQLPPQKA